MPEFIDEKHGVTVDTDGHDGGFLLRLPTAPKGRKPTSVQIHLTYDAAKALKDQIGFAVEFVELYARGPR